MTRRRTWTVATCTTVLLILASREAAAQGFGIYEHDACTMAMAGAGVADPCPDGSAIFFNPAGLADIEGTVFSLGGTLIGPFGDFTSDSGGTTDLLKKWINVPNLYYARDLGGRGKFGLGIMAPYGLEIGWPMPEWEGRFLAYDAKLQGVYFQPTVAFKATDQVLVGGGFDISYAKVELGRRADLSAQRLPGSTLTFAAIGVPRGTDFADIRLKGDSIQMGFHLGVIVKPTDRTSFGARYLSRHKVETDEGEFDTEQVNTGLRTLVPLGPTIPAGTPVDLLLQPQFAEGAALESGQAVSTSIYMPDQFVVGVMFKATDAWKLKVDYQFVNWSLFDVLVIEAENGTTDTTFEDYEDTHGIRLGTEYRLSDATALRGGFLGHTGGAPDQTVTPLLPEGKRWEFTVGVGHDFTRLLGVDFAYQYLYQPDRRGRTTSGGLERPTAAVNNGVYAFRAHLIGFNLRFKW
jgi:long-chain fatty acid transport protein